MNNPKLTKRPARKDLTNRECAKLLCAMIVPAETLFGEDALRTALNYLADNNAMWKHFKRKGKSESAFRKAQDARIKALPRRADISCEKCIGALVGGLTEMAELNAVRDAVMWTRDHLREILVGTRVMVEDEIRKGMVN